MPKFDSRAFLASKGKRPGLSMSTPLTDGSGFAKYKLAGRARAATAAGIAELASRQGDEVRLNLPAIVTEGGQKGSPYEYLTPVALAEFIGDTEGYFVEETPPAAKPKKGKKKGAGETPEGVPGQGQTEAA
jgi:hypothetical protein